MKNKNSDKLIKGLEFLGGERTAKSGFQTLYRSEKIETPSKNEPSVKEQLENFTEDTSIIEEPEFKSTAFGRDLTSLYTAEVGQLCPPHSS